jgi:hypothetical protein
VGERDRLEGTEATQGASIKGMRYAISVRGLLTDWLYAKLILA